MLGRSAIGSRSGLAIGTDGTVAGIKPELRVGRRGQTVIMSAKGRSSSHHGTGSAAAVDSVEGTLLNEPSNEALQPTSGAWGCAFRRLVPAPLAVERQAVRWTKERSCQTDY